MKFLSYDLRSRRFRDAEEPTSVCVNACESGKHFRAVRIDARNVLAAGQSLVSPVVLKLTIDGRAWSYTTPSGGDLALAAALPDHTGVLYWNVPYRSASAFSDALPLWDLTARGRARSFGIDAFPTRNWLAFSPDGRELLTVTGREREVFDSPHELTLCDLAAARCKPWHARPGSVELDPAWSPGGRTVAFVRAPVATQRQLSDGETYPRAWNATRRLVLVDRSAGVERSVPALGGSVFEPRWLDGDRLLAIAHDRLFEIDAARGSAVALASVAPDPQPYYGEEQVPGGGRYAVFIPR